MFGMGFTEILLVAIVAIIALGPEKLPQAMVDIAKFFRAFKRTIDDAKQSIDREIHLSELKQEASSYKNSIQEGLKSVSSQLNVTNVISDVTTSQNKNENSQISDVLKSLDDLSLDENNQQELKQEIKPMQPLEKTPHVLISSKPSQVGFGDHKKEELNLDGEKLRV